MTTTWANQALQRTGAGAIDFRVAHVAIVPGDRAPVAELGR